MTELALLAEEIGVNERTLRRAVNQGTLRAHRPTPRALELSLAERTYIRRSWSLLSALRGALRTERNVCSAVLHGSAATGTDTPASDVDIVVDLRDPSLERLVDLSTRLTAILGRRVALVRLREAEADPLFLADVISEGRVLIDREGVWPACARDLSVPSGEPSKTDRKRWARDVIRHLEDFPRQYAALEAAMAAFGGDFDLQEFTAAYETAEDLEAYNRVQALERALGRVQNYVADLANAGANLTQLSRPAMKHDGSSAQQAFEAMRDGKIIDSGLCRRLIRAQRARSMIEHSYVETPAGDVHRAAELVHQVAREFIGRYRTWIETHLE